MLSLETRLRPNEAEVAAEVMDGEAIMINLADGTYYSAGGVGGVVWELIADRRSLGEIAAVLSERYDAALDQIQVDVRQLASELLAERVVLVTEDASPTRTVEPWANAKEAYTAPRLTVYRDMADLLALDPPMPSLADVPWKDSATTRRG